MPKKTPAEVRTKLYNMLLTDVETSLQRYYAEFPERLGDDRSNDAINWSTRGIQRILRILDNYEFVEKVVEVIGECDE